MIPWLQIEMGHNVVKILDSRSGFTNIVKVSVQHLITSDITFYQIYEIYFSMGVWYDIDCIDLSGHYFSPKKQFLSSTHCYPSKIKDKLPSLLNSFSQPLPSLSNLWYCNSQICPTQKHLLQISSQGKRWHVEKGLYFVFCTYFWLN